MSTTDRLQLALRYLTETQHGPQNAQTMRSLCWKAMEALAPEVAMLTAKEAWEMFHEEK